MNRQAAVWVCLLVILAVVSANAAGLKSKKKKNSRIVNGRPIEISDAPYTVQLKNSNGFTFCGGSLVTDRHVISAAHCIKMNKPSNTYIVAGLTYSDEYGGEERTIVETFLPEGYNFVNQMSANDIVVYRLNRPIKMSPFIQTIDLCDMDMTPGTMAKVSGWGAQQVRGPPSVQLNSVQVPIVDTEECASLYSDLTTIYGSMICAANFEYSQDACQGDSGGPFVVNGRLCGAVSWGRGCARRDSPGIYTSINAMREFIDRSLNA